MVIKASIIGASGYTGIELVRLLTAHPVIKLAHLVSSSNANSEVATVFPHLTNYCTASFCNHDLAIIATSSDIIFLALPHTETINVIEQLIMYPVKIIDLSATLRLNDSNTFTKWYQHQSVAPDLLNQAVYGLSEINLEAITKAKLIANPGCYPTATILGLAPLLANNILNLNHDMPLIIDAKSGISGAGRVLSVNTHFCEVSNNFSAYNIGGLHRHIPEIEQELSKLAGENVLIQFTPHLLPIARGLMATIYCKLKDKFSLQAILGVYQQYYAKSSFIRLSLHEQPGLKAVVGSNFCDISLFLDHRTNNLIVISSIDNLIKGAVGQAIQNMNLIFQLPETTGLIQPAIYP